MEVKDLLLRLDALEAQLGHYVLMTRFQFKRLPPMQEVLETFPALRAKAAEEPYEVAFHIGRLEAILQTLFQQDGAKA